MPTTAAAAPAVDISDVYIDEDVVADYPGIRHVMTGTSPGEIDLHHPEKIPVCSVLYFKLISDFRKMLGANGLLYMDTLHNRWGERLGRNQQVENRTSMLSRVAHRVDPGMKIVTHADLEKAGLAKPLDLALARDVRKKANHAQREYSVFQTEVVRDCIALLEAQPGTFAKAGWGFKRTGQDLEKDRNILEGGEETFDKLLPAEWRVRPYHVMPGFGLTKKASSGMGKGAHVPDQAPAAAPYLYQEGKDDRCCVPVTAADIDVELGRIRPGITKVGYEILLVVAKIIRGDADASREARRLNATAWDMRVETVTDMPTILDVRDQMEDAMKRMLS